MKIAIIGSGIAGNILAYHLHNRHDITVYEANEHIGGHTHTHEVEVDNQSVHVDTGFIVFNHKTYPNFTRLLDELNVATEKSSMSFSVRCDTSGLEYNGTSINRLFSQRSNLFNRRFHDMIRDILRFNADAVAGLKAFPENERLSDFLNRHGYSQMFIDKYIIPMGAAIWSSDPDTILNFPFNFFAQFLHNHGMLSVNDRPDWHVISGGSHCYVKKLVQEFKHNIRLNTPVYLVKRFKDRVHIHTKHGIEVFDYVFFACHSDQTLNMLADPTPLETRIFTSIPYQPNIAVLHTDTSTLPRRKRAWAAWNYHLPKATQHRATLTYNMNILQNLRTRSTLCVTLNPTDEIDTSKIIKSIEYSHPIFSSDAVDTQKYHRLINGFNRSFYSGAYWGYGFHEDGVVSALNTLKDFEAFEHEQLPLQRAG